MVVCVIFLRFFIDQLFRASNSGFGVAKVFMWGGIWRSQASVLVSFWRASEEFGTLTHGKQSSKQI